MEHETLRSVSKPLALTNGTFIFYNRSHGESILVSMQAMVGINLICLEQGGIYDYERTDRKDTVSHSLKRKEEDAELSTLIKYAKENDVPIVFVDIELEEILGGIFKGAESLELEVTRRGVLAIFSGVFALGGIAAKSGVEYIPNELKNLKNSLDKFINVIITPAIAYLLAYGGITAIELIAKIILLTTLKQGHIKADSLRFLVFRITQKMKEFVDPHLDGVFINLRNKVMAYKTTVATLKQKGTSNENINVMVAPGAAHTQGISDSLRKDLNVQVEEIYNLAKELKLEQTLKNVIAKTSVCRWNKKEERWDVQITNDELLFERFNWV